MLSNYASLLKNSSPGQKNRRHIGRAAAFNSGKFVGDNIYYGERFNSITHAVGAALAVVGGVSLITIAARSGDYWKIVSFS
ncbi:hypothetical protein ACO0LF_31830, partial [Undibacterium sp. Di27W]